MPITDDVRKYGGTVLEQGKVALDEARKPWYAAVGAGELAYGQLSQQLTQLPAEVQARVRRLQTVPAQLDPAAVRGAVETATAQGLTQARETYESLAHRGELVVRRLRRSPEVKETFGKAQELVAEAGEAVAAAEDTVTKPGPTATRKPAAPKATPTARKAPAKRTAKSS